MYDDGKKWSAQEDNLLRAAVRRGGDWKVVAQMVPGRTCGQCRQRWANSVQPGLKKGLWSRQEDALLATVVQTCGAGMNWTELAKRIPGRTSKQCRVRWFNHLDPTLQKGAFMPQEDEIIVEQYMRIGSKWSTISTLLPGRTRDMVRFRFYRLRRDGHLDAQTSNPPKDAPMANHSANRQIPIGSETRIDIEAQSKQHKAAFDNTLGHAAKTPTTDDCSDLLQLFCAAAGTSPRASASERLLGDLNLDLLDDQIHTAIGRLIDSAEAAQIAELFLREFGTVIMGLV